MKFRLRIKDPFKAPHGAEHPTAMLLGAFVFMGVLLVLGAGLIVKTFDLRVPFPDLSGPARPTAAVPGDPVRPRRSRSVPAVQEAFSALQQLESSLDTLHMQATLVLGMPLERVRDRPTERLAQAILRSASLPKALADLIHVQSIAEEFPSKYKVLSQIEANTVQQKPTAMDQVRLQALMDWIRLRQEIIDFQAQNLNLIDRVLNTENRDSSVLCQERI